MVYGHKPHSYEYKLKFQLDQGRCKELSYTILATFSLKSWTYYFPSNDCDQSRALATKETPPTFPEFSLDIDRIVPTWLCFSLSLSKKFRLTTTHFNTFHWAKSHSYWAGHCMGLKIIFQ